MSLLSLLLLCGFFRQTFESSISFNLISGIDWLAGKHMDGWFWEELMSWSFLSR